MQPPSGGCVLKPPLTVAPLTVLPAAAFGRLCVETGFGFNILQLAEAAAFGRLCVETKCKRHSANGKLRSRLRAAVC